MSYKEWPRSLMYTNRLGQAKVRPPPQPLGEATSQEIGAYFMVSGKPRPNTAPPTNRRMPVPWMPAYNKGVRDYKKGF